ncbi:RNA-splicing factor [Naganishia albida]|nr:RNA-splicing factor [Naganishia albida]
MSYNGVGLQTARGTGTNGYVVRNLSHLRPRDGPPGGKTGDFGSGFGNDSGPPVHRQPDQGILDHEKKRKVEIRCLELRDELEEKGVDEDTIETEVANLRSRLQAQTQASSHVDIRNLKSSDSHALAAAKQAEMNKMGRALGIGAGYVEGGAFSRKDAELERIERAQRRAEAEQKRADEILKREQEREQREADFKERERLRLARLLFGMILHLGMLDLHLAVSTKITPVTINDLARLHLPITIPTSSASFGSRRLPEPIKIPSCPQTHEARFSISLAGYTAPSSSPGLFVVISITVTSTQTGFSVVFPLVAFSISQSASTNRSSDGLAFSHLASTTKPSTSFKIAVSSGQAQRRQG